MATTLEDLYAHPKFIEKAERPIKAKIASWKFQRTSSPSPSAATPIAVTLNSVKFLDEDEERIQGEVVVSAKVVVDATVTIPIPEGPDRITDREEIPQAFEGFMNFSLPWGWQARDVRFVAESAQLVLNDLQLSESS